MRDYDPTKGSYIEADPLGLVNGASVCAHAGQCLLVNADPTGECFGPAAALMPGCAGAVVNVTINWWLDPDCYTWEEMGHDAAYGFVEGAAFAGAGNAWKAWKGAK